MLTLAAGVTRTAGAQQMEGRFEVSGGVRWIGPIHFGEVPANETAPGGGTRPLFTSATTLDASFGATGTLGIRLSQLLRAEIAVAYSPTGLSTAISGDAEVAGNVTVDEPVSQVLLEGGVLAAPRRWQKGHVSPFLTAGIGYLRQLNDGRTLVEDGQSYYVGGGLYYVRASAHPRRLKARGVRVDLRALFLHDGVSLDHTTRSAPALTASVFARF
jgi:hypothetical protein